MLRIKEILKEKGITQTEFAGTLGISQVGLNKLINGNPSLSSLEKIATALGVPIKELFEDDPDNFITLYRKDEDGNFIEFGRVNKK
ncbi:XRE family transcriptional regulator [Riemerella anatipestifer]|uniref:helix-turn-helix domain-containing protein n=1 Tax=Riemerella anatipestifer TaxID=34085 RepID=UPI000D68E709|nr:helix-turn-helix transcriptional regulator [Riemerella anatipestifer]MDD1539531.1 helix-turn-helix transcriptional regulator [Riemerella anatipestifer]MDY3520612.1 helix-turn-helix transcriptional regulator [Riemerella anatipestifer]MDY3532335.1 helix-turn-helix transcriptional regulator [Riemerella anatipestifer]MDY3535110.1 helix-turn-helix transcriptional regulator [Riemerella anatipestifer]MRN16352.1 XRE family transcriptional regulator [Riemerella anatipestifer]